VEKDVIYAVGLLRVSSGRQITKGDSPEHQRRRINYWVDKTPLEVKR